MDKFMTIVSKLYILFTHKMEEMKKKCKVGIF